jgi:large subunit ribosomal protein L23
MHPNEAFFQVPLRFTKFDLRDYLWNLYNVEVTKVRVMVKQQALVSRVGLPGSYYRPRPHKFMTVELAKPFQWPELPDNPEAFMKSMFDIRDTAEREAREGSANASKGIIPSKAVVENGKPKPEEKERTRLRKAAEALLMGKTRWQNGVKLDPKFNSIETKTKAKDGSKEIVHKRTVDDQVTTKMQTGQAKTAKDSAREAVSRPDKKSSTVVQKRWAKAQKGQWLPSVRD